MGPTGKKFRVNCPKNCGESDTVCMGSMIYTSDGSSICKCAIHAGFLVDAEGGEFMLVIANGEGEYEGSMQNGI